MDTSPTEEPRTVLKLSGRMRVIPFETATYADEMPDASTPPAIDLEVELKRLVVRAAKQLRREGPKNFDNHADAVGSTVEDLLEIINENYAKYL